jgi:signal transduction histidine kinase
MMSAAESVDTARLLRLLAACRRGLGHDLTNQLVALRGLLLLLDQEEAERLSSAGREYVQRLLGVGARTQDLAHTLRDLAQLGGEEAAASEVISLPDIVEEAAAELVPQQACVGAWEAPRTFAPRQPVRQAVGQAIRLLAEFNRQCSARLDCGSRPAGPAIELRLKMGFAAGMSHPTTSAAIWHERLECVLLRELAFVWGGDVRWHFNGGGAEVTLRLPPSR